MKAPKLYWNDTGLLCYLLRIADPQELTIHPFKGPIAETYAVGECVKVINNSGGISDPFFWRDSNGREVDLLIDRGSQVDALEVKSSETIRDAYFAGLRTYRRIAGERCASTTLVYLGAENQKRSEHCVVSWRDLGRHLAGNYPRVVKFMTVGAGYPITQTAPAPRAQSTTPRASPAESRTSSRSRDWMLPKCTHCDMFAQCSDSTGMTRRTNG